MNYHDYSLFLMKLLGYIYTLFMILFIVGFFKTTPPLFLKFTFAIKVLLALFLIYRFNPYFNKRVQFTPLDREIVLFSAFFIIVSSFTDYVNSFLGEARKLVAIAKSYLQ